jgi:hypothetical protein
MKFKHGHAAGRGTRTYRSWQAMIDRCFNDKLPDYKNYGGRGITVDPRWLGEGGFANFLADMGERPARTSLDRENNEHGYSKTNCRWATRSQQARNTRVTKLDAAKVAIIKSSVATGRSMRAIARDLGVSHQTIRGVLQGRIWNDKQEAA